MSSPVVATTTSVARSPLYLESSPDDYRLSSRAGVLITLFGLTMLSVNLGSVRVLTFHETVFAQPAKEMLADGRWIVPTIAGVPFTDRTPLTAWCIALSMKLFASDAEWVVRLPSVLFAVATALLIASMAARWFGARVGLLAGLMELTTLQVLAHARLAEADMLLCFTVTAAMYAFAAAHIDGPRGLSRSRLLPYLFYGATAASFMVKWIFGPAFIGLGCLAYCAAARDRKALKFLLHPGGLLTAVLLTVPWMIAAYLEHPGIVAEFVYNHFGRFGGVMGAREPWYAYAYLVPFLLFPWAPYALLCFASRLRGTARFEPIGIFFLCWFLPGMALLSSSSFKAKHYTIPLLPPLVIAAAVGLHEYLKRRKLQPNQALSWILAATLVSGAGAVGCLLWKRPDDAPALAALVALLTLGAVVAMLCEQYRRFTLQLGTLFATLWLAAVGVQTWIIPSHDSFRPLAELGRRVTEIVPAGETVHLVQLPEVQIPYYIDRPLRRWDDPLVLPDVAKPAYIVTSHDYVGALAAHGAVMVLDEAHRIARHTYDRDRLVLLKFTPRQMNTAGASAALRK